MIVRISNIHRDGFWLRMSAQTESGTYRLSLGFWIKTPIGLVHVFNAEEIRLAEAAQRLGSSKQDAFRPTSTSARQEVIYRLPSLLKLRPFSKREVFGISHFLTEVVRFERHVKEVELPAVLTRENSK